MDFITFDDLNLDLIQIPGLANSCVEKNLKFISTDVTPI